MAETGKEESNGELTLLERIIEEGGMVNNPTQESYARLMLGQFATELLDEGMKFGPDSDVVAMINERISTIDALLSDHLNEIMHHEDFQNIEAAWTGLRDMVFGTETGPKLKLRLLNASKKDLLKDLETAVDYDMSNLFKKVYEDEYGTFGGSPYSMLLSDFYFSRHPQDIALLEKISKVALPKIQSDLQSKNKSLLNSTDITDLSWTIKMSDLYIIPPNYHISSINTELINSDYTCGFNIDLNVLSAFLKKKYKIYNSYKPDEYPGVLTKYYYHPENKCQGICECNPHCSIKDKKSRCCKITISIFRPGSIIITGAKSIEQLKHTYNFINKILADNYKYILGTEMEEEKVKKNPNENRKICRKPRLFYIEKTNIDKLPVEYCK